jgi:hypothetical protein
MKRFLSSLFSSVNAQSHGRFVAPKRRVRLGFECLEGRQMLSAFPAAVTTTLTSFINDPGILTEVPATTLTMDSATGFPSSGNFEVEIDNEVLEVVQDPYLQYTGVNEFDIVSRGMNGTQETAHNVGAAVTLLNSSAPVHTPPTLTAPNNQTAVEGVAETVALGSFSDPNSGPWTVLVNWGDGSSYSFAATTPGAISAKDAFEETGNLTATVTVTNSDSQSQSTAFHVNVAASPTPIVTGVGPASGLTSGGTTVTIQGKNLGTASTAKVLFGSTPAKILSDNGSTIVVSSPAGSNGIVNVTVITPGGTSAITPYDQFVYAAAPSKTSPSGVGNGLTYVFVNPTGQPQTIRYYDPPITVGYDYQVTSGPNFATIELPVGFTTTGYLLYLGNGQGGFQTTAYATLAGGVPFNLPAGVSEFRILGISSSANVDPTNPSAFVTGLEFASQAPVTFTMSPIVAPTVTSISPASGAATGGTTVTITGTNLGTAATATVQFGGKAATILSDNGTQITAISPAGTGTVDVMVTTAGGASATSAAARFSYGAPTFSNWSAPSGLGGTASQTVVVRNSAGGEEMFVIGGDGAVWHKWQTSPNGGTWTGWYRLGGSAKQITAATDANGTLQVFFIGTDNAVWHIAENTSGTWNSPVRLGGYAKQLAVAMNPSHELEIFYIGNDNAIWHRWETAANNSSSWSPEYSLGGYAKQFAVGTDADGRLEVFYIGNNNAIWHRWQLTSSGSWSGEASLGGYAKQLTVGQDADGRLEIFFIGSDNAVWHQWQTTPNGIWSGQFSLGGYVKQLTVARADGRLEIFFVGSDNGVWHQWQTSPNGNWSGQASLGGIVQQVSLGQMANGALDVFGIDMSFDVWERHQM